MIEQLTGQWVAGFNLPSAGQAWPILNEAQKTHFKAVEDLETLE
jgi:hypothetical protein